ncbi:hypothetical protein ACQEU8_03995 [Streptomyces sp. CA-250714]|uniref:hypothetical protein n=1 Tax=Streptomyces sp. CA-250714 TaxID=3240060 RepID=UPI003D91550D
MFRRKNGQPNQANDSPYWKQRSWIFSAVFLAAALVVGSVSYLTGSGDGEDERAAPSRKADSGPLSKGAPKGRGASAAERPDGCRIEAGTGGSKGSTQLPSSAPKDVAWRNLKGTMVPTSPSAGPTLVSGPVWWCYARTPMGAVMAAHSILTHMSGADWRTVAQQQLVAGEGREEFISQRSSIPQSEVENQEAGVYSGFTVQAFSRDAATVRIIMKSSSGSLTGTTVSLRWSGGDWKVQPRANGALYSSPTSTSSTGGFIRWGAA